MTLVTLLNPRQLKTALSTLPEKMQDRLYGGRAAIYGFDGTDAQGPRIYFRDQSGQTVIEVHIDACRVVVYEDFGQKFDSGQQIHIHYCFKDRMIHEYWPKASTPDQFARRSMENLAPNDKEEAQSFERLLSVCAPMTTRPSPKPPAEKNSPRP